MLGRLIAAAVALILTGAPVITLACETSCATRAHEGDSKGEHHSCHHETTASGGVVVGSGTHVCGHADEPPMAVAVSLWALNGPAVLVAAFTLAAPAAVGRHVRANRPQHGPPLITSSSAPLRL
jgi:hypothetical protein